MYQALYRKWRPKTFSEVVGQEHITETLRHQVAQQRTAHAYLFTGTRGTGKTTCARILAKAINCAHPVNGEPCNTCDACRGIDEGTLLDVTELDAASNNGVDHVRALREEAIYTPAVLKKRVYIIDEVHMLTREAFNALLKILEEPPEHLVFILATTELHKVPATILSRCQRFSFKRILPEDIRRQLLQIAQAESIPLTDDGAGILARMAGGALRDALSLLDQCRGSSETLDAAAVLDALGLAGSIQTAELMTLVLQRDTAGALALFDRLYRSGKDVSALLGELLDLCRDLTITKAAPPCSIPAAPWQTVSISGRKRSCACCASVMSPCPAISPPWCSGWTGWKSRCKAASLPPPSPTGKVPRRRNLLRCKRRLRLIRLLLSKRNRRCRRNHRYWKSPAESGYLTYRRNFKNPRLPSPRLPSPRFPSPLCPSPRLPAATAPCGAGCWTSIRAVCR